MNASELFWKITVCLIREVSGILVLDLREVFVVRINCLKVNVVELM